MYAYPALFTFDRIPEHRVEHVTSRKLTAHSLETRAPVPTTMKT
jgi:hypothetical protein